MCLAPEWPLPPLPLLPLPLLLESPQGLSRSEGMSTLPAPSVRGRLVAAGAVAGPPLPLPLPPAEVVLALRLVAAALASISILAACLWRMRGKA